MTRCSVTPPNAAPRRAHHDTATSNPQANPIRATNIPARHPWRASDRTGDYSGYLHGRAASNAALTCSNSPSA
jgi:hypothetical protein